MIWALVSMLMASVSNVLQKKIVGFGEKNSLTDFLRQFPTFVIFVLLFFLLGTQHDGLSWGVFGLILGAVIVYAFSRIGKLHALHKEKLSALMPYSKVTDVTTISLGFILFRDISLISFLIGLVAMGIIVASSINPRTFRMSKIIFMYILSRMSCAIGNILLGYALLQISAFNYFVYYAFISTIIAFIYIFLRGEGSELRALKNGSYLQTTFIGGFLGWFSWFISLVVVKELGLSITTLIGMLGMVVALVFGYILLKDKPSKKDMILSFVIAGLVTIGFYFK